MFKKIIVIVIICIVFLTILEGAQALLVENYSMDAAMEQMEISGDSYAAMEEYNNIMIFIALLELIVSSGTVVYIIYNLRKVILGYENF